MLRTSQIALLALAVATLGATANRANAQTVAYKSHGTGVYSPVTGAYSGVGVGTHLGAQTFLGEVATFPTSQLLVFDFELVVPQEMIAANGDKLYFAGSGQVTLVPLDATFTVFSAIWTGDFEIVGGTGRFATAGPAAEPLHVVAINDPFTFADPEWSFSWTLSGEIVLH